MAHAIVRDVRSRYVKLLKKCQVLHVSKSSIGCWLGLQVEKTQLLQSADSFHGVIYGLLGGIIQIYGTLSSPTKA